jgi:hypothetical protein
VAPWSRGTDREGWRNAAPARGGAVAVRLVAVSAARATAVSTGSLDGDFSGTLLVADGLPVLVLGTPPGGRGSVARPARRLGFSGLGSRAVAGRTFACRGRR